MIGFYNAARLAVLMAGASGLAIAFPADAQKKGKDAPAANAAPALKLSNEVRAAAVKAQAALQANDLVAAEPAIVATEAAAKTEDEQYFASSVRLKFESLRLTASAAGDPAAFARGERVLAAPLDALIANPKTPKADVARFVNLRGKIEQDAGKPKEALAFYVKSRELGFQSADLGLSIVKARIDSGDVPGGTAELKQLIAAEEAAGRKAPEAWYRYGIAKLNAAKLRPQTIEWLQNLAVAYPTPKNWRDVIITYGFEGSTASRLDKRQRVDLFRLLRAAGALADQADFAEYAQATYDIGLPNESVAVIKEGRASGKIPATSASANQLLADSSKAAAVESLASLEKQAAAAKTGELAAQTADAYLGSSNYAKAIELYTMALAKGVSKLDEVQTHIGIAQALNGDKAAAKASFAKVTVAPRSEIASFWSVWSNSRAPAS
ncbi:MAG: hypothetical protein ACKVOB_12030 [Sphingomonas sp.]